MSKVDLIIPTDPEILRAIGRVAASHAQLELVLRYCVKTLTASPVNEALDATAKQSMRELRARVRKLFSETKPTETHMSKMDALLSKTERLSDKRNRLVHRPWSQSPDGKMFMKDDDHKWGDAPSASNLDQLADEILKHSIQINEERLNGFIKDAMKKKKNV